LSLAVSRALTGDHVFQRCRVLIISLEDGAKELRRRILAARIHHGISREELAGWLFLAAPGLDDGEKLLEVDPKGRLVTGGLASRIEEAIVRLKIDIISLDPLVKLHSVGENDNSAMDKVASILTRIAIKHNIAVDVPHHNSKGPSDPGNAKRGRGASSTKDAFRLVYTLTPMGDTEAKDFGLSEAERRYLIRMDSGKVNIAPPSEDATWFKLVGVNIGNGNEQYPNGDNVQTVERWIPPPLFQDVSRPTINDILNEIDAGLPDGNRYTDAPNATERAAWRIVVKHVKDKTTEEARRMIGSWRASGLLIAKDYKNPNTTKKVRGLWVDDSKRP
jgi:AAA domain